MLHELASPELSATLTQLFKELYHQSEEDSIINILRKDITTSNVETHVIPRA